MAKRLFPCFLLALVFLFSGCAVKTEIVKPTVDIRQFSNAEAWLAMQKKSSDPMPVVQNDNPVGDRLLRTKSLPLNPNDPLVKHLQARMFASVQLEKGVGIAGPQVGINRRIIWVRWVDPDVPNPWKVYYNPQIVSFSPETVSDWEGCLSVPAGFAKVTRPASIVVSHETPDGQIVQEKVVGFTARIFQHEIDHLDGVLFIDRKDPGNLVPKDEYRKMRQKEKEAKEQLSQPATDLSQQATQPPVQPAPAQENTPQNQVKE